MTTPLFQQQQHPRPPQHQQQRGQQQQQNNQQQRAPPSNQDKGKKKKQQQQGTCGGINRDAGNSGGNGSGNCPHGHSHFASVASTITPPFSVTKRKDRVALNAIEQSLRAEIASENTYPLLTSRDPWAGYIPPSTWDETYPDLNFKAVSRLPPSCARGSPPPATFKGFWDDSCDSTLAQAPPPPQKKKNPAVMQKFTGFKPSDVPKTMRYLKPLKNVVASKVHRSDQLVSKARTSLEDRIGPVASSSKRTLEEDDKEDDGPGYSSSSSSKRACSIGSDEVDEDVDMGDGNDLTSLSGDDVDDDIAEAAGVEEDVLDNVSLGSFYDDLDALH
ncbi:hypothetical protein PQX77_021673 [Marasmius sp. AFHP31]|nr:hypothetical protein PQX77_021673 [Marasmius sp. AFHP31]